MPRKKTVPPAEEAAELLGTLVIIQLRQLGANNKQIRRIVGCAMSRVNAVLRNLPKEKKEKGAKK